MPILQRPTCNQDLVCTVNVQHDCHHGGCLATRAVPCIQERTLTSQSRMVLEHTNQTRFVLNTASLHNHKHITSALPIPLRHYSFKINDVALLRRTAAASLRDRKQQQIEEKKNLLMAKVMGRAGAPPLPRTGDTAVSEDVTANIQDDEEFVDVLESMFVGQDGTAVGDEDSGAWPQLEHSGDDQVFDRIFDSVVSGRKTPGKIKAVRPQIMTMCVRAHFFVYLCKSINTDGVYSAKSARTML